jgi:hypothetical protein
MVTFAVRKGIKNLNNKGLSSATFLEKLKTKWGLKSLFQVVLILIVFALTGSSVLFLKPLVFKLIGFEHLTGWKGTVLYLLLIFPMYQVLLLCYGFIFGQFDFFWAKEKKLVSLIGRLFIKKK